MTQLIHELIFQRADSPADCVALQGSRQALSYDALAGAVKAAANLFLNLGLDRRERVAVIYGKAR